MGDFMKKAFLALSTFFSILFFLVACGTESKNPAVNTSTTEIKVSANSLSDVFEVIDFLPGEELPANATYPTIQLQFSEPVIALQELGTPSDTSPYVTIEPELKGTYRWYGTSLLSFVSSEEIIPQKNYTVKVAPDMVSVSGKSLSGPTEFSFHSEELKITSIIAGFENYKKGEGSTYYSDYWPLGISDAIDLGVCFNSPVNPKVIKEFLQITDSDSKSYDFTVEPSDLDENIKNAKNIVRVKINDTPKDGTKLTVSLPIGAQSDTDTYKTTKVSKEILPIKESFAYSSTGIYADSNGYKNHLNFNFNNKIKQKQEEKILSLLSFDKDIKITKDNIKISYSSVVVHDLPVDYEESFVVTLKPGLEDVDGRQITDTIVESLTVPIAKGYVNYKSYNDFVMLEAKYTPRLAFMHRNVTQGYYKLRPITGIGGKVPTKEESIHGLNIGEKNKAILETVELSEVLDSTSSGNFHGIVEFTSNISYNTTEYDWKTRSTKPTIKTNERQQYIQVTDLGVTVRYGYNQAAVLVTNLETGEPVANAEVGAYFTNSYMSVKFMQNPDINRKVGSGVTNEQGLAVLDLDYGSKGDNYYFYIYVKTPDDSALFEPQGHNKWNSSIADIGSVNEGFCSKPLAYMYSDRKLYKPGETVTVKVIDRTLEKGKFSPYTGNYVINLSDAWSWDAKTYQTKKGSSNKFGSSWTEFKIPEDMKPGTYSITYSREKSDTIQRCYIDVQYFERAKFEVKTSIDKDKIYYTGDKISATVTSNYLGGGNMGESSYNSYWSRQPTRFNPGEEFADMSFGPIEGYYDGRSDLDNSAGKLDGTGSVELSQTSGGEKIKGLPYAYSLNSTITDSGNQSISSTASVIVHPAKFYLGLSGIKNVSGYPTKNTQLKFDYVCTDVNGESPDSSVLPKNKSIKMELLHEEWEEVNQLAWNGEITTRWNKKLVSDLSKTISLSGKKDATEISVKPESGGAYILRLSTEDSKGNEIIAERSFYVTGGDWYWFSRDNSEEISLTTDKPEYKVGETAHILMQSPLPKGTYLITLEREGLFDKQIRTINEPTSVLDFEVKDSYTPVMYVAVSSFSCRTEESPEKFSGKDMGKPKSYFGVTAINVNTQNRRFDIDITTDKDTYEPGSKATIKVHASTSTGPVKNAEIAIMAVDRGVLDLINYHVDNPLDFFYDRENFPECVAGGDSRSILIDPVNYTASSQFGGDKGGDSSSESGPDSTRSNFNPLAMFAPSLVTDENGNAEYTFTLPDSLTAYRITAVGNTVDKFSLSEKEFNVANKISVRPVLPRQLRIKDKSEIGVTISNLTESTQNVNVTANIRGGVQQFDDVIQKLPGNIQVMENPSKAISIPANSTKTLLFNVEAKKAGWITIEFEVKSNLLNEKILLPLQIEKPYIYESVTTIGSTDGNEENESAEERIIIPSDAEDNMGYLSVQLDPTRLGVLKEAVDYNFHYPYGCLEQRSSAILPLVIFGEYIKTFGLDNEVKNPKSVIEKEIKSWGNSQLGNGSFPYWPDSKYSNSYVSARIGEIVGLAKKKNYKVDGINVEALGRFLKEEARILLKDEKPHKSQIYDAAHYIYVASLLNQNGLEDLTNKIMSEKDIDSTVVSLCGLIYNNIGLESKCADMVKKLKSQISLTTQGADMYDSGEDGYWSIFSDESEKFALAIQLLSRTNPDDNILQHLIFELLQLQKAGKGYWKSTCATSRVLTAFDEYIRANDLTNLDFTAEALLDKKSIVKGDFKGVASTAVEKTFDFGDKTLSPLPKDKEVELLFKKKGEGKLFYTASLKYAIPPEKQIARDEGLCVFTEIFDGSTKEKVDSNKLVSGKSYIMKAYISSTRNRQYVAMRVPVPAGCEILNAAFVTTGTIPHTEVSVYNRGLSYEGIYDSEVQYFWDYFPRGHQEVEYAFRAVRNGEYNTPSSTAECMYEPEIFGRSSGKKWTIE